jgi:hypothetical protein
MAPDGLPDRPSSYGDFDADHPNIDGPIRHGSFKGVREDLLDHQHSQDLIGQAQSVS